LAAFVWLLLLLLFVVFTKEEVSVVVVPQKNWTWRLSRLFFIITSAQPLWMFAFGLVLLVSHSRMITRGITTNEAKKWKSASYAYLRDEKGRFRNPFDQRTAVSNCLVFWTRGGRGILKFFTSLFGRSNHGKGAKQG
jgi:hypothetical protein